MKNPVRNWEMAVASSDLSARGKVVCFTIGALQNSRHDPMVRLTMPDLCDMTNLSRTEINNHLQRAERLSLVRVGFGPYPDSLTVCRTLPAGF